MMDISLLYFRHANGIGGHRRSYHHRIDIHHRAVHPRQRKQGQKAATEAPADARPPWGKCWRIACHLATASEPSVNPQSATAGTVIPPNRCNGWLITCGTWLPAHKHDEKWTDRKLSWQGYTECGIEMDALTPHKATDPPQTRKGVGKIEDTGIKHCLLTEKGEAMRITDKTHIAKRHPGETIDALVALFVRNRTWQKNGYGREQKVGVDSPQQGQHQTAVGQRLSHHRRQHQGPDRWNQISVPTVSCPTPALV